MSEHAILRVWDLIDRASTIEGATAIHVAVGRPPMIRGADRELHSLDPDAPVLTWKSIQVMLSMAVEPEEWDAIEQMGEGEVLLVGGAGRSVRMVLFRNSEAWSAVIHL